MVELRRLNTDKDSIISAANFNLMECWVAYFGDPEFAMDALEKGINIDASGLFQIWLPVMREVRQTPQFKKFVKKIGFVDYWDKFGWTEMCRQLDDGDFECD